jgi:succinate-acetate transporter protein
VTGGFAAAAVSQREASGQQILGEGEVAEQGEFALTPASGFGAFWSSVHLKAIMHSESMKIKSIFRTRK